MEQGIQCVIDLCSLFMLTSGLTESDLIHVNVLGQPIVVIHSLRAGMELLEKRGSIHSDRTTCTFFLMFVVSSELCTMKRTD